MPLSPNTHCLTVFVEDFHGMISCFSFATSITGLYIFLFIFFILGRTQRTKMYTYTKVTLYHCLSTIVPFPLLVCAYIVLGQSTLRSSTVSQHTAILAYLLHKCSTRDLFSGVISDHTSPRHTVHTSPTAPRQTHTSGPGYSMLNPAKNGME